MRTRILNTFVWKCLWSMDMELQFVMLCARHRKLHQAAFAQLCAGSQQRVCHRSFFNFGMFTGGQPKVRDYEVDAAFPPIEALMQEGHWPRGIDSFDQRRHAVEEHLRMLQPMRSGLDAGIAPGSFSAEMRRRAHYTSVMMSLSSSFKDVFNTAIQAQSKAMRDRVKEKMKETDSANPFESQSLNFLKEQIADVEDFIDENKGFCLKPEPYILPYHCKGSSVEHDSTLAEGALLAFEHVTSLIAEADWTELNHLLKAGEVTAAVQESFEALYPAQRDLLQLSRSDLCYWPVPQYDVGKLMSSENDFLSGKLPEHRKVRIVSADDSPPTGNESYTALLAACYRRQLLNSNLIAAVANHEAYGYSIPRFVFVALRFEREPDEAEWDLADLNYIAMP